MGKRTAGVTFLSIIILYFVLVIFLLVTADRVNISIAGSCILSEGIIILPALIAALVTTKGKDTLKSLGFKKIKFTTLLAVLLYGLLLMPLTTLINAITMLFVDNTFVSSSDSILGIGFPVAFIIMALYGPFCEEFAFRGVIFRGFSKENKGWGALILSSLLFGLMHMNLNQCAYAFVLGTCFAMVVEATGSIWASIACHVLFNAINIIEMFAIDKLIPGYYNSDAAAAAMSSDALIMMIGVLFIVASITTVLAMCLLGWIAHREGNEHPFKSLKGKKGPLLTAPLVVAICLAAAYIIYDTYLMIMV